MPADPNTEPAPRAGLTGLQWLGLLALLGASFWARCARWREVFTADGVELIPSDSHYYVRFGLMQLGHFPLFRAFDPFLNYPEGAFNLWPPIHAWLVALAIAIGGREQPELAAAWVGPAIATVELAIIFTLARNSWGVGRAFATAWIYGLLPVLVWAGSLGNADHHVHEAFVVACACLTGGQALATGKRGPAIACGAVLGLGRLLTTSAFAVLPAAALAWPLVVWLKADAPGATLKVGLTTAATCVGLLLLSVLSLGRPLSLEYQELSLFHPLFAAAVFLGALGLMAWPSRRRVSLALLVGAVAASVPLTFELLRMAQHIGRVDAALAWVDESTPLLKDPKWAVELLGVTLFALPFGCWGAVRALRAKQPALALTLLCTLAFTAAAAAQARFAQPLGGALAVLLPTALPTWRRPGSSPGLNRALVALGVVLFGTLAFSLQPAAPDPTPDVVVKVRPTLKWMRDHLPPATPDPFGDERPAWGVAASPLLGNFIMLWAERPAVALMRSQARVHDEGLIRSAAILGSTDDEEAFTRARASGVRYVVATPSDAPLGTIGVYDKKRALLARLEDDAAVSATDPALTTGHFALIHDSPEQRRRADGGSYTRVFEVVEGAILSGGGAAGARAEAALEVRVEEGTALSYLRAGTVGADGGLQLRVAYPGRYRVHLDGRESAAAVEEADVRLGRQVPVSEVPAPSQP